MVTFGRTRGVIVGGTGVRDGPIRAISIQTNFSKVFAIYP